MSIYEYDEEKVLAWIRQDEREDGIAIGELKGKIDSILELLSDLGSIPEPLIERIQAEKDTATLSRWHRLAARAESISQFTEQIK